MTTLITLILAASLLLAGIGAACLLLSKQALNRAAKAYTAAAKLTHSRACYARRAVEANDSEQLKLTEMEQALELYKKELYACRK